MTKVVLKQAEEISPSMTVPPSTRAGVPDSCVTDWLRCALPLIVEAPAGALEPLVERTGDRWRHRAEACPLRLRAADLLLCGSPRRFVGLGAAAPGHGVG